MNQCKRHLPPLHASGILQKAHDMFAVKTTHILFSKKTYLFDYESDVVEQVKRQWQELFVLTNETLRSESWNIEARKDFLLEYFQPKN